MTFYISQSQFDLGWRLTKPFCKGIMTIETTNSRIVKQSWNHVYHVSVKCRVWDLGCISAEVPSLPWRRFPSLKKKREHSEYVNSKQTHVTHARRNLKQRGATTSWSWPVSAFSWALYTCTILYLYTSGKHRFWTWLSTCRTWEPRSSWIDPGNGSPCKLETHTVDDHCHHGNQPWRWKTMGFSNGKQCWDLGMTLTSNYIPCLSDPKTRHMLNKLINAFCMLFAMWRYQHLCGQGDKSVFIRSTKDSKQYNNIQQRVRQGEATWFSSSNKSMEHSQCCPTWPVELQCLKTGFGVPPTWLRFQVKRYRRSAFTETLLPLKWRVCRFLAM